MRSKRLRPAMSRLFRHCSHGAPEGNLVSRRLAVESLEDRRVLAAVSWDGGGDGINWSDGLNWSTNALPTSADDVTISVPGTITVTHASGNDTIRSLTSAENLTITGGQLTVTTGASSVSGTFNLSNLAQLGVNGAGASFVANSTTTLNGGNLFAGAGGQINLPNATTYAEAPFSNTSFQATGAGSKIDLTSVTSITGTNGSLSVQSTAGGTIELDGVASTTARDLNFTVDGAGSVLNLNVMTSISDTSLQSNLTIGNGGSLIAPVLATYSGGTITVNNQTVTLSTLTNVDTSSLIAGAAGILTLPNVTSYAEGAFANTYFQANGAGSKLDLTAITSITGTTGTLNVQPTLGGTIELDGLPSTTARDINFVVDGAGNVLKLDLLTNFTDTSLQSNLTVGNGGTLTAPVLATYSGGTITVNNQSVTFTALTNANASSLIANSAGVLTLTNLASYAEGPFANTYFQANGAGSKLDLTALTSITGTNGTLNIQPTSGGTIELDGLPSTTAHDINFMVDGAGSALKLDVLTNVTDTSLQSNLTVGNGATLTAPVLATYGGGTITVNNQSVTFTALTNVNASSLIANTAGILTLPNVTSYVEGPFANTYFQANGAGSKLDLTAITSITGTTGTLNVQPTAGGTIELDGLPNTTAHDINFVVDGAGNVLKLDVLTNVTDTSLQSNLTVGNGGTLTAPVLATYSGGTISVNNQSVTLSSLTNVNSSSLITNSAGVFTLPNVTSYAEGPFANTYFQANGAGSKLDLTALTSITGTNGTLNVQALTGGLVEIDGLASTTANDVNLTADGAGSVVLATALANISDANLQSGIFANNSGSVQLIGSGSATLVGVDVLLGGGSVTAGTLVIGTASKLRGTGTVNANVVNDGLAAPATPPSTTTGKLTINGSYTQSGTGTFAVDLNGLTPQTQYDQIAPTGAVTLGGTLTISRTYLPAIGESFRIIDKTSPGTVSGTFLNSPEGDIYTVNGIPLQLSYIGGDGNDVTLTRVANLVVDRKLFYDQSAFDGNIAGPSGSDDAAIATDKTAYRPNNTLAVFANVSSFTRGINGIMVDFSGPHGTITANDFVFKIGNNNSPGSWISAPGNSGFTVRTAAGYRGADRIEITWASGSISNKWLEVQVLANGTTNAITTDVHFWGNKVGDTGQATPPTTFLTSGVDKSSVLGSLGPAGGVTKIQDFNRDNTISGVDASVAIGSLGSIVRINIGAAGPFAPEGDGGVASALAAAATGTGVSPAAATVFVGMPAADLPPSPEIAAPREATGQFAGALDLVLLASNVADEGFDLDDELISSLLAD